MRLFVNLEVSFDAHGKCGAKCSATAGNWKVNRSPIPLDKGEPAIGLEPMTC